MPKDLEQAVSELLRAEWEFRSGPQAYQAEPANWFDKAMRRVRRALTGKGDLDEAYKVLKEKDNGGASC